MGEWVLGNLDLRSFDRSIGKGVPHSIAIVPSAQARRALTILLIIVGMIASLFGPWSASPARASGDPDDRAAMDIVVSEDDASNIPWVVGSGTGDYVSGVVEVGNTVVVAGSFDAVQNPGSQTQISRSNIFAFNKATGQVTNFNPGVTGGSVASIVAAPDGQSVIIGGNFTSVGGQSSNNLAKINVSTGQRDASFPTASGRVRGVAIAGNDLYIGGNISSVGGQSRERVAKLNATTGAVDPNFSFSIPVPRAGSPSWVNQLDVSPDGQNIIIIGNFLEVNGQERVQIAMLGSDGSLRPWQTDRYSPACSDSFWTYMRDIEFSPDSSYFVPVTTGAGFNNSLCDTATRWPTEPNNTDPDPDWISRSGGDTLTAVAVTTGAIYVGGHQRWMNNRQVFDFASTGAVNRSGMGALHPDNGVPHSWNPGRSRGVGVSDFFVASDGVYMGADTNTPGRLAFYPASGGTPVPGETPAELPVDFYATHTDSTLTTRPYSGVAGGETEVTGTGIDWSVLDGVTLENGKIYYTLGDDRLYSRTFDGEDFGPQVDLFAGVYAANDDGEIQYPFLENINAMTFNDARFLYTRAGQNSMFWRWFSLESDIVGSEIFSITQGQLGFSANTITGMEVIGDFLYYTRTDNNLYSMAIQDGLPVPSTAQLVSGPGVDGQSWANLDFFVAEGEGTVVDEVAPVITLIGGDEIIVEQNSVFEDPGATAFDNVDGLIPFEDITVTGSVDTSTLGDYELAYNVSDSAGNAADEVVRTVHVVEEFVYLYRVNANGPTIDMGGEPDFLGLPANDLDAVPGLTVTGDTQGNPGTVPPFNSVPLGVPPELFESVIGTNQGTGSSFDFAFDVPDGVYEVRMYFGEHNDTITQPGERVFDVLLEGNVVLDNYDMLAVAGAPLIGIVESQLVTVTDGQLNFGVSAVVSVGIIRGIEILATDFEPGDDLEAPVITLNGSAEMSVNQNSVFTDPGATATDNVDPSVTVIVGGDTVNTAVLGDYTITYDATDVAGNSAVQKTRLVHVVEEGTVGREVDFLGGELLGIATDSSIVVNVIPQVEDTNVYVEWGTETGVYTNETDPVLIEADEPQDIVIDGLAGSTRYFYRVRYRAEADGDGVFNARDEHSFHTARSRGEEFVFTMITDSHQNIAGAGGILGNAARYMDTVENVEADQPDLHIDLGDTFMVNGATSQAQVDDRYEFQRDFFGVFGHSTPSYIVLGNHENEEGWHFDETNFPGDEINQAYASMRSRKAYFPTPVTDGFYTGNDNPLTEIGMEDNLPENYYAWEWGDALFVALDPFQKTMLKPYSGGPGEGGPAENTDNWIWTLGDDQYFWLQDTLENSTAKYKFVFSHHITGGFPDGHEKNTQNSGWINPGYVHAAGAYAADYFEWGGIGADGSTNEFAQERPGWEKPIHQLLIDTGVTAYIHGHDHQYSAEERDGIVYLGLPQPSTTGAGFAGMFEDSPYIMMEGGQPVVIDNSGHLRVTISPDEAVAEYVRTEGNVAHTLTMLPHEIEVDPDDIVYRVSAGSADVAANDGGPTWEGVDDTNLTTAVPGLVITGTPDAPTVGDSPGGSTWSNLPDWVPAGVFANILGTANQAGATQNWAFDVDDGEYLVRMYFGEHNDTITGPGLRVFDIALEGEVVRDDYDMLEIADDPFTALVESEIVEVTDGVLNLDIAAEVSVGNIRGVEVIRMGVAGPDDEAPVITLTGPAVMAIEVGDTFTDPGSVVTDNVDDGLTAAVGGSVDTGTPGVYVLTYDAQDTAGNNATQVTRTVHVVESFDIVQRVSAGSADVAATDGGPTWEGVTPPNLATDIANLVVTGTPSDPTVGNSPGGFTWTGIPTWVPEGVFANILGTANSSGANQNWEFDLDNGTYLVRMHFGEHNTTQITGVGDRVFDVSLQGEVVLDNYDMWDEAGPGIALMESAVAEVTSGTLDLDITAVQSVAVIRGLEIIRLSGDVGPDTTPPVITLVGDAEVTVEVGGTYTELGATAFDNVDGDLSGSITVGGDTVNTSVVGDYVVTYNVSDAALNAAVEVTRTVHVVEVVDYRYRVSAGSGDVASVDAGPDWLGVAPPNLATDVPGLVVTGSPSAPTVGTSGSAFSGVPADVPAGVFTNVLGTANQAGATQTWTFDDLEDGLYQVRMLFGEHAGSIDAVGERVFDVALEGEVVLDDYDMFSEAGGQFIALSETISDVEVTGGSLEMVITAQVSVGVIRGIEIIRTGDLATDTTAPVITLVGDAEVQLEVGGTYTEQGATALDDTDGDITDSIVIDDDAVNTSVVGDYVVTYNVSDAAGNAAVEVVRIVHVVDSDPGSGVVQRADFDGDGAMDIAVFRPSAGRWYVQGQSTVSFGTDGDIPVPGDYDGDGAADFALFRPSTSSWYVLGQPRVGWGSPGDIPVPGDYDGDGSVDIAVFRPSSGRWYIQGMSSVGFGANGDIPVPGDYDGDGITDIAMFRPSVGRWYVQGQGTVGWGQEGDVPVPADYDGDGSTDIAVYRPSTGRWYVEGQESISFGVPGDVPVPGDYDGDGAAEVAVYRPSAGRWYVQGMPAVSWGNNGDVPAPALPSVYLLTVP